ncbi:hypothetical protein [Burkholderia cepacia]|uniref:hypothetical protein n=1 Tax=Burkholderia cepacia TaxID=292 RepID=UPI002FE19202
MEEKLTSAVNKQHHIRHTSENTCRLIVESALQNAVTALQRNAEALHARVAPTTKIRRNAFQNLAEGSTLWVAAIGHGYDKHLTAVEMEQLTTCPP